METGDIHSIGASVAVEPDLIVAAEVVEDSEDQVSSALDFGTRLLALDGLRGAAILAVFFFHYAGGVGAHTSSVFLRRASAIFAVGWSGVDLFFVLSGFLITGILYDTRDDTSYYRNFYARRALRIFPAYYLLIAILACLGPFLGVHWGPGHLLFLVYLGYPASLIWPSLITVAPMLGITHLWSLSVEEQFYMVWPWLIAKLRSPDAILKGSIVVSALALLLRMLIWLSGWPISNWATGFLLCRMDELALGACIAILMRGPRQQSILRWAPFMFIVAGACVVSMFAIRKTVDRADATVWTVGYSLIGIFYGTLLLLCLKPASSFQRLFSWSVLRMFGRYSYGLYLYHFPLAVVLSPLRERFVSWTHSFWVGSTLHITTCLLVNLLIAALSYRFFESPILRLKNRFSYPTERTAG